VLSTRDTESTFYDIVRFFTSKSAYRFYRLSEYSVESQYVLKREYS